MFAKGNQGRHYIDFSFFGPGMNDPVEGLVIGRAAVRISRTVLLDGANIDFFRSQHLRPTDRDREKMGIAEGDVSDRDVVADGMRLGDGDIGIGQCRASDGAQGFVSHQQAVPYFQAITDFQAELALNPGHAQTYYKLADAYSRVQKFDDAERLLQRSIWLDSTSTGPYILMGKVLQKKGESELAVRALQHALGMDPNNSVTHHLLGQAYRDMGRTEDSERELKIAQQLNAAGGDK